MSKIIAIHAREILDSRGTPTVECDIKTTDGVFRASAPSGASTGTHEAVEIRDCGNRYFGLGVQQAVHSINTSLAKKLKGKNPTRQEELDELLIAIDGTTNKKRLGANAILPLSLAIARAGAAANKQPLYQHIAKLFSNKKISIPIPSFNIINGGKHAGSNLDIQEFHIIPTGAKTFSDALCISAEFYHALKNQLQHTDKRAINVGDEGGFTPQFRTTEQALETLNDLALKLGYSKKIKLGIDAAATTFWKSGTYYLNSKEYNPEDLLCYYEHLSQTYPLLSIEDPFYEEDFEHFAQLTKTLPHLAIIGDDLLCTNPERIKIAIRHKSCNTLLLKVNQIGTLTEALRCATLARENNWQIMTSHRSGETEDTFISDLAVGIGSTFIKTGAPARGERTSKYNQLLRIEEHLGKKATYAGKHHPTH